MRKAGAAKPRLAPRFDADAEAAPGQSESTEEESPADHGEVRGAGAWETVHTKGILGNILHDIYAPIRYYIAKQ